MKQAYTNTAYNSRHIVLQEKPNPKGLWQSLITKGQLFNFKQSTLTIATAAVRHNTPSQWQSIIDRLNNNILSDVVWDEQRLEQEVFSSWTQLYLILSGMAKVCCQFMLPLVAIISLTMPLYDDKMNFSQALETFSVVLLYIFLPLGLLWGQFELANRGYFTPWFLKTKKQFSLNRQTGMVTLFKSNGKPRFTHPFIEFDCILVSMPNHQGILNYALYLVHRYNGCAHGVPLQTLMPSHQLVAEYHALWNMIQRYMDVSQPMPDILILEATRERDSTTAQFDKDGRRGHPNNYWRDMSDEEFTEVIDTIQLKQQKSLMLGSKINIFKEEFAES